MTKTSALRQKSEVDLLKLLATNEVELAQFRFGGAGGKVTNVKAGRNLRREIARVKTILGARK